MTNKGMSFSLGYTIQEKADKALQNLDQKKTCQKNDIPLKKKKYICKITLGYIFLLYTS